MAKPVYPLQSLLNVRYYREDNAKVALNNAKREKKEAEDYVEECKQALQDYIAWRIAEEDRRFEEVLGTVRTLQEIDELKQYIADLKIKEVLLEENIEKARQEVIKKEENEQKAKEALSNAQKETMKILAHQDIWKVEVQKEAMRLEDVEMEEFKPKTVNEFE